MTLTSDRATKGLYEKYVSPPKRWGDSAQFTRWITNRQDLNSKRWWLVAKSGGKYCKYETQMVIQTNVGQSLSHKFVSIVTGGNKWLKLLLGLPEKTMEKQGWLNTSTIHQSLPSDFLHIRCLHLATILRNNLVLVFPATTTWAMSMLFLPNLYSLHLPCVPISIVLLDFPRSTSAAYLHILVEKLLYTSTWQNVLFSTWLQQVR